MYSGTNKFLCKKISMKIKLRLHVINVSLLQLLYILVTLVVAVVNMNGMLSGSLVTFYVS